MVFSFDFCPRQFYKNYILGERKEKTQSMLMGIRLHEFFDRFFEYYNVIPIERWLDVIPDDFNEMEKQAAYNFIVYEIERYLDFQKDNKIEYFKPQSREIFLVSEEPKLRGYIDRIDWYDQENNEVVLVEYKTGYSTQTSKIKQELEFYVYMTEQSDDVDFVVKQYMLYNPTIESYNIWYPSQRSRNLMLKKYNKLLKALEDNNFETEYNMHKCNVCGMCSAEELV